MGKTANTCARRCREAVCEEYSAGKGIDIGDGENRITPDVRQWERHDGDAQTFEGLENWGRLVKPGGHRILVLPDRTLYGRGHWRGKCNVCHRWSVALDKPVLKEAGLARAGNATHPSDQNRAFTPGLEITPLGEESSPITGTAAIILNLDLVITVDTLAAHLAGALGKPVWTLLSFVADWRWLLDREDSPWYPTMRLFRQPRAGDWKAVMKRAREALEHDQRR